MYVCIPHAYPGPAEEEENIAALTLKSQTVNHSVGLISRTQVRCKNSKYLQPLSQFSSSQILFLKIVWYPHSFFVVVISATKKKKLSRKFTYQPL